MAKSHKVLPPIKDVFHVEQDLREEARKLKQQRIDGFYRDALVAFIMMLVFFFALLVFGNLIALQPTTLPQVAQ